MRRIFSKPSVWILSTISLVLISGMMPTSADTQQTKKDTEVTVTSSALNLKDLAEGESRTLNVGRDTITLTRKGDSVVITSSDGKEPITIPFASLDGKEGSKQSFIILSEDEKDQGNEKALTKKKIVIGSAAHGGMEEELAAGSKVVIVNKENKDGQESELSVDASTDKGELKVNVNGQISVFSIKDLADGESKTFTVENHTIVVTRKGQGISVKVNGDNVQ